MSDFKLGDRVKISGTVEKSKSTTRTTYAERGVPVQKSWRKDDPANSNGWTRHEKSLDDGIVVGRRTLYDYTLDLGGWDGPNTALQVPGSGRRAWLVAVRLDRRPVLVLDSQISALDRKDES